MEQQETQQKSQERIVRILSKDIEGRMKLYAGLTKIKGVSWTISNAVCNLLKIDKNKRWIETLNISDYDKDERKYDLNSQEFLNKTNKILGSSDNLAKKTILYFVQVCTAGLT